jgi:hypothetical protein
MMSFQVPIPTRLILGIKMAQSKESFRYEPLSNEDMKSWCESFTACIPSFSSFFDIPLEKINYPLPLIFEIYKRIDQRKDYYLYFHSNKEKPMEMDQTKEVALLAFWTIKYKPLILPVYEANVLFNQRGCTINELFAVFLIYSYVKRLSGRTDIEKYFSPAGINKITYSFMHRDISKEAMILYVDSLLNKE